MTIDGTERAFRRLVYTSASNRGDGRGDHLEILRQSRANNGLLGISGFLWTDGRGYLQVLEGAPENVEYIMARIRDDPRHSDVRVLSDEGADARAFGDWAMASLPAERDEAMVRERVGRMLRDAPDDVRGAFSTAGLG